MSAKLYTIDGTKEIPCLNNICGPVTEPVPLSREDVIDLLKRGFSVYQVNPHDKTEKVLVTRSNINSVVFKSTRAGATSKRLLNREIQKMSAPVTVDVVHKNQSTKVEEKTEKKSETNTSSETKKNNKQSASANTEDSKVTTPDNFSK
jgi:hypothetical protein